MARHLWEGHAHIALTAMDNVVAYVEDQGEEPLAGSADFFAFLGVDDGLLSLMARPEIRTLNAIKGQTLAQLRQFPEQKPSISIR
jgi:hypothetical protein